VILVCGECAVAAYNDVFKLVPPVVIRPNLIAVQRPLCDAVLFEIPEDAIAFRFFSLWSSADWSF